MNNVINEFKEKYHFLSNFSTSPIEIEYIKYPTVEHYFQAMKSFITTERLKIARAPTPGEAKRLGRQLRLRPDWEEMKIYLMRWGLDRKFENPILAGKLIATFPNNLIEGNRWGDTFWGVNINTMKGENHLGKLLMEIRNDLIITTINERR